MIIRPVPLSILAIFAHPDDEIGVGSTLAYYADQGVVITLVCASRGEAATIYCEDCATRENLAEVRTRELECAGRLLGITDLRWLDWPDGGIKDLPRGKATGQVVGLIRETQPDILLTHPEHGLYPHPDHLSIWDVVRRAFDEAGDANRFEHTGLPWGPARLFTRALPKSFFDAVPGFADYRVELKGELLPFYSTPDEMVNVTMRVVSWADRRMAAWDCHRSQHNPEGAFATMPDGLRREMAENEHYVLESARVPLPPGLQDDLFSGLERGPRDLISSSGDVALASLAVRRAYHTVYDEYVEMAPEEHFKTVLKELHEREQEFFYALASALRRADVTATGVQPDPRLLLQARACKTSRSRIRFLRTTARHAVAFAEQQALTPEGDGRELWEEILPLARENYALIDELASYI